MKIALISTIRGKEFQLQALEKIISFLKSKKHDVFYQHLTDTSQQKMDDMSFNEDLKFHMRILSEIEKADLVISEASHQSLSVGYLISYAVEKGKPTIVLYSSKSPKPNLFYTLSFSDKLILSDYYSIDDIPENLKACICTIMEQQDTRYNLIIPLKMNNYLKKYSKVNNISRASYIRSLIRKQMEE